MSNRHSRRSFLKQTALSTAAFVIPPSLAHRLPIGGRRQTLT